MKTRIFNTNLIYFIILTLFVGVRIGTSLNAFSFLGDYASLILTSVIQIGLLFILPLFLSSKMNKKSARETMKDFNFKKIGFSSILISILLGCIVFVLTVAISSFFSYVLALLGYSQITGGGAVPATWEAFILSVLTVAVLPAICEEFTHRGMLISGYKTLGLKKAIMYSALLFGLLHLNVDQFFYATLIGMVLGLVTIISRSIIPAIIIHFMNNFINVYLNFAQAKGLPGGNLISNINGFLSSGNVFLSILFIFLLVILLFMLMIYLISSLFKINAKKSLQDYAERAAIEQMRSHVLGEVATKSDTIPVPPIIFNRNSLRNSVKVSIPYEVLGFYMTPQIKPSFLDNLFLYASLFLSGLITLFTFIWGVL